MTLWLIRSGKDEMFLKTFLDNNVMVVGWSVPNLSDIKSIDDVINIFTATYPQEKNRTLENWARQMWSFKEKIAIGDTIITPLNKGSKYAVGKIVGYYEYRLDLPNNAKHSREVQWIKLDINRREIKSDILSSLGSITTVCQINRGNAEDYIKSII